MPTRILIVDDSPFARKLLQKALPSGPAVEVSQVGSGREAVEHCRTGRVDVMFLDLTMPDMDGYQVLEALRRNGSRCLVIVVSADVQPEAQERVRQLGAAAFVRKPADASRIQATLRDHGVLV